MTASASPKSELKPLVRLALPLIVINLGYQCMSLVDTALAGRIDELSLAAVGLGSTVFFLGAVFGIGVSAGVDPLASQALGGGRFRDARKAMWHGIYGGLLIVLPVAAFILALAYSLEWMGVEPQLAAHTRRYIWGRMPSLPPLFTLMAVRAYLQASHYPRPIVVATLTANVFNLTANWLLIWGDEGLTYLGLPAMGLPPLGVVGIGLATAVATFSQLLILIKPLSSLDPGPGEGSVSAFRARRLRRHFSIGLPIGFQLMAEMGIFAAVGILAGTLGTLPMAAHQIALQLAAFTFMLPLSLGEATSVQVGRAIGRGDTPAARWAGLCGILLGGGVMLMAAIFMWTLPQAFARIVSSQQEVIELASGLIIVAGFFQIFDGIQAVSSGCLRGAGMTRWAMLANVFCYWIIGFPAAFLMALPLGWGAPGLWWGLTVGLGMAAVILSIKFAWVSRRPIAALETA
ncbi:MAG TPA: MATE family efflux transporter [Acidobacteriota bacterium]|nr:MATE family efflux transporter [Acidobacteriota bacterium]